jgi:hypothetical protein
MGQCFGEDCGFWHKRLNQCAVLSIADGLNEQPGEKPEEPLDAIEISDELAAKLIAERLLTFSDIDKAGGITEIMLKGIITPAEAEELSSSYRAYVEKNKA